MTLWPLSPYSGHAGRVPLPTAVAGRPPYRLQHWKRRELGEELVVLLEADLGLLEHLLGLVGPGNLHELAEAVLAEFLRDRVRGEGDRVALVLRVEREAVLALGRLARVALRGS